MWSLPIRVFWDDVRGTPLHLKDPPQLFVFVVVYACKLYKYKCAPCSMFAVQILLCCSCTVYCVSSCTKLCQSLCTSSFYSYVLLSSQILCRYKTTENDKRVNSFGHDIIDWLFEANIITNLLFVVCVLSYLIYTLPQNYTVDVHMCAIKVIDVNYPFLVCTPQLRILNQSIWKSGGLPESSLEISRHLQFRILLWIKLSSKVVFECPFTEKSFKVGHCFEQNVSN